MDAEELEWIMEFLENQGFSYYAEKVKELYDDCEKLCAKVEDLEYDKLGV